jgi:hypothetical protein
MEDKALKAFNHQGHQVHQVRQNKNFGLNIKDFLGALSALGG